MKNIKTILVATDFQPASDNALRYGRALAGAFGARLHVLHVTANFYLAAASAYGYSGVPLNVHQDIEAAALRQTERLLTDEERRTGRAIATTVSAVSPAAAIVDYAARHEIDLLVMGTHGRGPLSQVLMGSVARRVVRTALCPVLIVRDREHEFVVADVATVAAGATVAAAATARVSHEPAARA